jgi:hypothetical protein
MKHKLLILSIAILSCGKDSVSPSENSLGILEVSPFLVEKSLTKSSSLPSSSGVWTNYSYDENYLFLEEGMDYSPENIGSSVLPFAKKGTEEIFVDTDRRVTRRKYQNVVEDYFYSTDGRLNYIVRDFVGESLNNKPLKDTVQYSYYGKGQKDHEGEVLIVKENQYYVDNKLQKYFDYVRYTTEYYDAEKELKSWITRPYSYGKQMKAPLIRRTSTSKKGSLSTEYWAHDYDEQGLITHTKYSTLGIISDTDYFYIKPGTK